MGSDGLRCDSDGKDTTRIPRRRLGDESDAVGTIRVAIRVERERQEGEDEDEERERKDRERKERERERERERIAGGR